MIAERQEAEAGPGTGRVVEVARRARRASRRLSTVTAEQKNAVLLAYADRLEARSAEILEANALDLEDARPLVESGELSQPLFDRLGLDAVKLAVMAASVRSVAALEEPCGRVLEETLLDDGLTLRKVTCPLGVLAVIFESRPDAVTQISSLALKSGNAVILKGGREAARTTAALVAVLHDVLDEGPIPKDAVQTLLGREEIDELLALDGDVDLVIPRGGNALVRYIQTHTRIPVLGHAEGVCHIYLDRAADAAMATALVRDSKLQYPAACNAVETLLVHTDAATRLLGPILSDLFGLGVELRACERTRALFPSLPLLQATEEDWRTEYSAPVLAVKVVDSLDEAVLHIDRYGSSHTETIVTDDAAAAARFLAEVDSAGVFHNASTRFADGFRYGFGAEVGIATGKLHARGPVGLQGLVSYKYLVNGSGHVVATYSGASARPFKHERLF